MLSAFDIFHAGSHACFHSHAGRLVAPVSS
ncbi:hypothetical protein BCL93_101360 [Onishia taeanensis]|uniref:Uncharacterized protein n=1 Tax=Onishia taeanensis TaxID=284577 RepID=A0A328XW99_9GAMM|nr:hypothetical protein BCL93_101360 [Halomonas taeanensis]